MRMICDVNLQVFEGHKMTFQLASSVSLPRNVSVAQSTVKYKIIPSARTTDGVVCYRVRPKMIARTVLASFS